MLSDLFKPFVEASPVSVMMQGLAERLLVPEQLDQWFQQFAQEQYIRELLFSTVVSLMLEVVCGTRKSVNAAYQAMQAAIPVSIQAVYEKLRGVEPGVAAELVRYAARDGQAVIAALAGASPALLPGYPVRILDGNHLAATEHRLKPLRTYAGGALPGLALVVYDPDQDLVIDVVPCENGHTQERALLAALAATVAPGQVWVMDRNFCVLGWLHQIAGHSAYFVAREHEQAPFTVVGAMQEVGETETGRVGEQPIQVMRPEGPELGWRRIRVLLSQPTRTGDDHLYLWTNLPATVTAMMIARVYLKRWRIETAFQHLAQDLNTEINTLGYPRAALFGFCIGLVAYNSLAVLKAALRRVHGAAVIDTQLSGYYLAEEVSATYRGMMIAIPPPQWQCFRCLTIPELAAVLLELAGKVHVAQFRKHPRGPKKPRPPRQYDTKHPHQATAKLLTTRRQ
jgi:hypothetical protein